MNYQDMLRSLQSRYGNATLERLLGISSKSEGKTIRRWLAGSRHPSAETQLKIRKLYESPPPVVSDIPYTATFISNPVLGFSELSRIANDSRSRRRNYLQTLTKRERIAELQREIEESIMTDWGGSDFSQLQIVPYLDYKELSRLRKQHNQLGFAFIENTKLSDDVGVLRTVAATLMFLNSYQDARNLLSFFVHNQYVSEDVVDFLTSMLQLMTAFRRNRRA